jgi:hypothetical protein
MTDEVNNIILVISTGVKGMLPLGCLPLWGREGVTLIILGLPQQHYK